MRAWNKVNIRNSLAPIIVVVFFSLGLGVSFIGSVGPLSLPDPMMHCDEIYALLSGQSFSSSTPWIDEPGNEQMIQRMTIDKRVGESKFHNATMSSIITLPMSTDTSRSEQIKSLTAPYDGDVEGVRRRSQYFPFVYAPQAAAVGLVTSLGGTPWTALQAARLLNFIIALVIEIASIVILPRGKWSYVSICLMPVSIFSAVSISIDALVLPFSMLLIALATMSLDIGKMSNGVIALSTLLVIALLFWKTAYASLALILLVLPNKVVSPRKKVVSAIIACATFLIVHWWWISTTGLSFTPAERNLSENVAWMSSHVLETVASFVITYASLPFYLTKYGLNYFVPIMISFAAVLACRYRSKMPSQAVRSLPSRVKKWRLPFAGIAAALLSLLALFVTFALAWTVFGNGGWASGLLGMQERYLIPLFPLFVLLLYPVIDKKPHVSSGGNGQDLLDSGGNALGIER